MSLSEDELMDRNQYTTERKREEGRIQAREQNILNYINECCDDPEKLLNDMDDYEIRKMAYRWVEIWKTLNSSEGYNPALAMRKTEDVIAMTAKEIAESKFGY